MNNFNIITKFPYPTITCSDNTSSIYNCLWFNNNTQISNQSSITITDNISGQLYNIHNTHNYSNQSNVYNLNFIDNLEFINNEYTFNVNISETNILSSNDTSIIEINKNKAFVKTPGVCDISYINTLTNEYAVLSNISCSLSSYKPINFTITNQFLSRIVDADKTKCHKIFTLQDHTNRNYIRNPDCWASKYNTDLTCISPWNNKNHNYKAGTAITKRHILNARHYTYPVGTVVRFITNNNEIVERTIISSFPSISSHIDICVYTLDEDLPETITPCKILPHNYSHYIDESDLQIHPIPILTLDYEEKANIHSCIRINGNNGVIYKRTYVQKPKRISELKFYEQAISGDSGNPLFMIIDNQLVLLAVWYTASSGSSCTYFGNLLDDNPLSLNYMISQSDKNAKINTGYKISYFKFN